MCKEKDTASANLAAYIQRDRKKIEGCGQTIVDFVMDKEEQVLRLISPEHSARFVVTDNQIGDSSKAIDFANTLLSNNNQIAVSWRLAMVKETDDVEMIFKLPDLVDKDSAHVGFVVESESCIRRIQACLPEVRIFRVS